MIPKSRLLSEVFKDLHPVLRHLAEKYSGEVNVDFLFRGNSNDRIVLDLSSEKTGERKLIGIKPRSASMVIGRQLRTSISSEPIYDDISRYFVNIGYVKQSDRKIHTEVLHLPLDGVENDVQGISELEKIAHNLKRVYGLTYTPHVYKNGTFWR